MPGLKSDGLTGGVTEYKGLTVIICNVVELLATMLPALGVPYIKDVSPLVDKGAYTRLFSTSTVVDVEFTCRKLMLFPGALKN